MSIFSFFMLFGIVGCDKEEDINPENITVERYLNLLSDDKYDKEMPALSPSDIPALLEYRNDTRIITNYPRNPVSSFYSPDCKLGLYALWTIESVRAVEIDSEFLIMRYPSLNPFLGCRNGEYIEIDDELAHEITAEAYFDWWESNQDKSIPEIMAIDPLAETEFLWR